MQTPRDGILFDAQRDAAMLDLEKESEGATNGWIQRVAFVMNAQIDESDVVTGHRSLQ